MRAPHQAAVTAARAMVDYDVDPDLAVAVAEARELTAVERARLSAVFVLHASGRPVGPAFDLAGGAPMFEALQAAAQAPYATLNRVLGELQRDWADLDRRAVTELSGVISTAWQAAATAVARQPGTANIPATISPIVDAACGQARAILARYWPVAIQQLGDTLGVIHDRSHTDQANQAADRACEWLRRALTDWLVFRNTDTPAAQPGPTQPDPTVPPAFLSAGVLSIGGGAAVTGDRPAVDPIGRTVSEDGEPAGGSVLTGALMVGAIGAAVAAWGTGRATARRVNGARVGGRLAGQLEQAAAEQPKIVARARWELNYYGPIETEHFPPHERLAGTEVEQLSDLTRLDAARNPDQWPDGGTHYPGSHPYCQCGWRVVFRLQPEA